MSVFSIGVSGLNAANLGLVTTGHNIANASTPGYSRQSIVQSAVYPQQTGSGFVGMGVQVDTIKRAYDQFLTKNLQSATSQNSYLTSYLSQLQDIDNIVADPTAGVSPALQDFFTSVQGVSSNPSDSPSRTAMLTSAQTLVSRFQTFNTELQQEASTTNGQITDTVSNINAITSQIANLNTQISVLGNSGQPPNDLMDQRDELVQNLNQYVKATTVTNSDGTMNVFIGNGQNVVVNGTAFQLAAVQSPSNPQNISVAYKLNNTTVYLPDNSLAGGSLQGLLDFRNNSLTLAQNTLNLTAIGLAQTFNAQQKAGQDLNGNIGQNIFSYQAASSFTANVNGVNVNVSLPTASSPTPQSDFSLAYDSTTGNYTLTRMTDNSTATITGAQMTAGFTALGVTLQSGSTPAASGTGTFTFPPALGSVNANSLNTGNAQLSGYIGDATKLTTSNYKFSYDGTNYTLTRLSDNTQTTFTAAQVAAGPVGTDGFLVNISSGTMNTGDSFNIQPVANVISNLSVATTDPSLVAAAAPMTATANINNTGSVTLTQPTVDTPPTSTTSGSLNPAVKNPVTLSFTSPTTFTLTDSTTGVTTAAQTYTAGMTVSYNGWNMVLNGTPATGDTISVGPTVAGTSDNRNALALGKLQTSKLLLNGSVTYQDAYSNMVSNIGTETNQIQVMSQAQTTVLTNAQTARDSLAGVNLDEEAANLLRYQQAYQAASKVIQIAQEAFQSIVNIG
ncbi:flagellar hook-associated protein FlgK [Silvimonas iriomotensis]|uniref:Flagellar hook-associated protein 1 n=1 Tax=Silvimonas iriomotensis TaxID=449662 RepID=A0ABQ2P4W9_9NEIS|nr:flagellar hook-associated protein FlgK [Silvimonas iriomotensis]GGP18270.1 flagellar hook-associated protein FlgK [Silvimonas iriomotensis]